MRSLSEFGRHRPTQTSIRSIWAGSAGLRVRVLQFIELHEYFKSIKSKCEHFYTFIGHEHKEWVTREFTLISWYQTHNAYMTLKNHYYLVILIFLNSVFFFVSFLKIKIFFYLDEKNQTFCSPQNCDDKYKCKFKKYFFKLNSKTFFHFYLNFYRFAYIHGRANKRVASFCCY